MGVIGSLGGVLLGVESGFVGREELRGSFGAAVFGDGRFINHMCMRREVQQEFVIGDNTLPPL